MHSPPSGYGWSDRYKYPWPKQVRKIRTRILVTENALYKFLLQLSLTLLPGLAAASLPQAVFQPTLLSSYAPTDWPQLPQKSTVTEPPPTEFDTHEVFTQVYPKAPMAFEKYYFPSTDTDRVRDKLVFQAELFSDLSYVPYIWGGDRIGSRSQCDRCSRCLQRYRGGVKTREKYCPSCQQCGIDCSHLTSMIYNSAGIPIPYGSTSELLRQSSRGLKKHYGLLDMGADASKALPGDLLLYRKHIVFLLDTDGRGNGSIVHSTAVTKDRVGGIRYLENISLGPFRGGLKRILRHRKLARSPKAAPKSSTPTKSFKKSGLG